MVNDENKFLFRNKHGNNLLIYKMNRPQDLTDKKVYCKFNRLKPHLYENPYIIPCRNSACQIFILKYFHPNKNFIQCDFESCKEKHFLREHFEKNREFDRLMSENIHELLAIIRFD